VTEIPPDLWQDELGRLRVWAANIGAHQTGRSSLDYRLRDASNIRDQIIRLLKGLQRAFDDLEEVLEEAEGDTIPIEVDSELEEIQGSEVQQIFKGLVNTIDCLFQLSMVIRRPTQHDRFMGIKKADSAPFEFYDVQHVDNKYPEADKNIINRLGIAISRRRAGLKYRERHHAKLSKGLNNALDNQSEARSTVLSETIATEFEVHQHIQFDETASNSGVSQTSYAQTLLESDSRISIPSPPKESADGKVFECPYCFLIITIQDRRSWIRHVFTDLMPYVCVFPDCFTPAMLYASRQEWYHHLQTSHSIQAKQDAEFHCPLCQEKATSGVRLDRHIGRHLEELALFALPRLDDDEDRASGADAEPERNTGVPHGNQSDDDDVQLYSPAFSGRTEDQEETVSNDASKDEAIARLEKLILEERAEREARDAAIAKPAADRFKKETLSSSDASKDEAIARLEKLILEERAERETREAIRAKPAADRSKQETLSSSDASKDGAIARLEKLILEERAEREARDAAREAAIAKPAADKPERETAAAETNIAEEHSGVHNTVKPRVVAATTNVNNATGSIVPSWQCHKCGDGPYGNWQISCQFCAHRRCALCIRVSNFEFDSITF
jgi:hypothetical protein